MHVRLWHATPAPMPTQQVCCMCTMAACACQNKEHTCSGFCICAICCCSTVSWFRVASCCASKTPQISTHGATTQGILGSEVVALIHPNLAYVILALPTMPPWHISA
jgi:hypothetical protein